MKKDTLITIAVIVVIFYILKKTLNFFSTPETSPTSGSSQTNVIVNKGNLTYEDVVYNGLADSIQAAVWGGLLAVTEDDAAIFDALNKMQNIDDVTRLIQVYGVRGEGIILQEYYNLPQTISMYLDNDYKEQINALYLQRGINYQW